MRTERGTKLERRIWEKTGTGGGKEEMEMEGSLLNELSFSPLGNTNCKTKNVSRLCIIQVNLTSLSRTIFKLTTQVNNRTSCKTGKNQST